VDSRVCTPALAWACRSPRSRADSISVDGQGVRHAATIADAAAAGELWVSATAGMLLAGSGVQLLPVPSENDVAGQQLLRVVG
jgi:hypothetical protein